LRSIILFFFILDGLNFSYSYLDRWKSFEHEPSHGQSCIYPIDLVVVLICLKKMTMNFLIHHASNGCLQKTFGFMELV
jgi:hypothetical protein